MNTTTNTTPKPKGAAGSFDIPAHAHNSTEGARRAFAEFWGEDFRGNDADIRAIAKEVPTTNELCKGKTKAVAAPLAPFGTVSRCEHMLWLMRERC